MNKLVIVVLAAFIVLAASEPPSSYGSPSQPLYSVSDDTNEGAVVDAELLARIAQILGESSSSSSGYSAPQQGYSAPQQGYSAPQQGYAAPADSYGPPQNSYGAPARSSGIQLGRPERAQLISEFELQDNSGGYGAPSRGGY